MLLLTIDMPWNSHNLMIASKVFDMMVCFSLVAQIGGLWYAHYFRPSVISTLLTLINYKGFMANITDTAEPMVKNFAASLWYVKTQLIAI